MWTLGRSSGPEVEDAVTARYRGPSLDAEIAVGAHRVSPRGIELRTETPPPVGSVVAVELSGPHDDPIEGIALVTWVDPPGDEPGTVALRLVHFDDWPAARSLLAGLPGGFSSSVGTQEGIELATVAGRRGARTSDAPGARRAITLARRGELELVRAGAMKPVTTPQGRLLSVVTAAMVMAAMVLLVWRLSW